MTLFKDLTNQRFDRLLVISKDDNLLPSGKRRRAKWLCKCDCGNEKSIYASALISGHVRSCGCLHSEFNSLKYNENRENIYFYKLYKMYKNRSKDYNYEFKITFEEFMEVIKNTCYYCGSAGEEKIVSSGHGRRFLIFANGIDRINSSYGYILNNIVACCKKCNYAKRDMSKEEFLDWVVKIYNYNFLINKEKII